MKAGAPHLTQYRVWDQRGLRAALQQRIDRKDDPSKLKGGPYERYILVIVTDEIYLTEANVETFLSDAGFRAGLVTDACLGLAYHPADPAQGREGSCPVFRLTIEPR